MVKRIGDREYIYVRHGRSWHYVGPLSNVDLSGMLNSPTTSLPLKGGAGHAFVSEKNTGFTKVLAQVVGVIIIIIGISIISWIGFALPLSLFSLSPTARIGQHVMVFGSGSEILAVFPSSMMPYNGGTATVIINASNTLLKIANQSAILPALRTQVMEQLSAGEQWLNSSEVNATYFKGNYTAYRAVLKPGQVLLVWPYRITGVLPSIYMETTITQETKPQGVEFNYASLLLIIPLIAVGAAMIWGGIVLFRWGRRK